MLFIWNVLLIIHFFIVLILQLPPELVDFINSFSEYIKHWLPIIHFTNGLGMWDDGSKATEWTAGQGRGLSPLGVGCISSHSGPVSILPPSLKTLGFYRSGHWCPLGSCSWTYLGGWLDSLWFQICVVSAPFQWPSQFSLAFSYKATLTKPVIPSKKNENTCLHKDLYTNNYTSFIHDHQKVETTQMSEWIVMHSYNRILLK